MRAMTKVMKKRMAGNLLRSKKITMTKTMIRLIVLFIKIKVATSRLSMTLRYWKVEKAWKKK